MKNLIPITNLPNVYGVKIPSSVINYNICNNRLEYFLDGKPVAIFLSQSPKDKFRDLGYVTATEISFDASEIVDYRRGESGDDLWINYKDNNFYLDYSSQESFRSALEVEGIRFENEFGEKPDCGCNTEYDREGCPDKCYQWINAENAKTQKLLIIIKV